MVYNKNEMDALIFGFIYGAAMHDAIMQKSFESKKKDWVEKVPEAKDFVKAYIDRVLQGDFCKADEATRMAHDAYFLETANKVCNAINTHSGRAPGSAVFSFGNAQKLINMTVKHVYAHTYTKPAIRENFRHCHCPLDQNMLTKVTTAYIDSFGKSEKLRVLGPNNTFHAAWGKEGAVAAEQPRLLEFPVRYAAYQAAIRAIIDANSGNLFPVEFDYREWKK